MLVNDDNTMKRRSGYNPKRKIIAVLTEDRRRELAERASYGGNPEHKRMPADYGLAPPPNPRPRKTLCDAEGPFLKSDAEALLKAGMAKGMVSQQDRNGWPQNVWAVSEAGVAFAAQVENSLRGVYHGYPMAEDDDFKDVVLEEWFAR